MIRTKILLFGISIVLGLPSYAQVSGVRICAQDKKTKQLMSNAAVQITFDDSLKLDLKFDEEGCIKKIEQKPGKYKISVFIEGYLQHSITGVIIGEGKTAYLVYGVQAIKDLTKKERKFYGIKRK